MKKIRKDVRSAHHGNVMESLARARPARLNADVVVRGDWPPARDIIEAAGTANDGTACYPSKTGHRERGWAAKRLTHPYRYKLAGAITSAALTAIVIVIAVALSTGLLGSPFPGHSPPVSAVVSPSAISFQLLPLHDRWRGWIAYAVSDGIVFVAGSARASGTAGAIATLPPGARPADQIDIVVTLGLGEDGSIQVMPDGRIQAFSPRNQVKTVSLGGVSFPIGSG